MPRGLVRLTWPKVLRYCNKRSSGKAFCDARGMLALNSGRLF